MRLKPYFTWALVAGTLDLVLLLVRLAVQQAMTPTTLVSGGLWTWNGWLNKIWHLLHWPVDTLVMPFMIAAFASEASADLFAMAVPGKVEFVTYAGLCILQVTAIGLLLGLAANSLKRPRIVD